MKYFQELFIASRLTPGKVDKDDVQTFEFPKAGTLTTNNPLIREILVRLSSAWPASIQISEFSTHELDPDSVAGLLMQLIRNKALEVRVSPPKTAEAIGERPIASALARAQISQGYPMVTNQRHQNVELKDEGSRKLISLLDGTRNRAALIREMAVFESDTEETIRMMDTALSELHRLCLLVD
jgi:hypothetical protein